MGREVEINDHLTYQGASHGRLVAHQRDNVTDATLARAELVSGAASTAPQFIQQLFHKIIRRGNSLFQTELVMTRDLSSVARAQRLRMRASIASRGASESLDSATISASAS